MAPPNVHCSVFQCAAAVQPLAGAESAWAICDSDNGGSTTVVVGPPNSSAQVLTAEQMILVATGSSSPTYLLYGGRRAVVDLADPAVVWALRLQGRVPHVVAQSLLNAVPEAPRITAPRIRGGGRASVGLPGFLVGGVVRITRASGDELRGAGGRRAAHRPGRRGFVAVRRFAGQRQRPDGGPRCDSRRSIVNTLPVSAFPDRPPTPVDGSPGRAVTTLRDLDARAAGCCSRRVLGGQRPAGAPRRGSGDTGTSRRSRPRTGDAVCRRARSAYVAAHGLSGGGTGALPGHRHRGAVRDPRRRRGTTSVCRRLPSRRRGRC
ncbi:type VII secretion protein EccB [Mycobacterium tuberculosis]